MGTKRSVLTVEKGLPLSVVLSGANAHDIKLLEETLDSIIISRPAVSENHPQNLCLDAGYTGSTQSVEKRQYTAHIRPRGEERKEVEVTQSLYYRVVVIKAPLQGLYYTVRNAVDWLFSPTTQMVPERFQPQPFAVC